MLFYIEKASATIGGQKLMLFRTSRKPPFTHHFQCHKKLEPPIRPSPLRGNASASPRFKGTGFASCSPCSQVPLRSTCCAWVRASLDPGRSGRCLVFIGDGRTGDSRLLLRGGSGPRVSVPTHSPCVPFCDLRGLLPSNCLSKRLGGAVHPYAVAPPSLQVGGRKAFG